jgi:hypothetical protein
MVGHRIPTADCHRPQSINIFLGRYVRYARHSSADTEDTFCSVNPNFFVTLSQNSYLVTPPRDPKFTVIGGIWTQAVAIAADKIFKVTGLNQISLTTSIA